MTDIKMLIGKIETLEKKGLTEEEIKVILDLSEPISIIKSRYEREKDLLTAEEVAEILTKNLKSDKSTVWNYHKVLRLAKDGKLKGQKDSNYKGWRFRKEDVEEFIKEESKTIEDYKRELQMAKDEIQQLKEVIKNLQEGKKVTKPNKNRNTRGKSTPVVEQEVESGQLEIKDDGSVE